MAFVKHSLIFIFRLLWISLKYSPILIAWLLIGTITIDVITQMISSAKSTPPMSVWEQLGILLSIWFLVTGLAAVKTLSK